MPSWKKQTCKHDRPGFTIPRQRSRGPGRASAPPSPGPNKRESLGAGQATLASSEVVIEPLEGIADEGKAHLGALLLLRRAGTAGAPRRLRGPEQRRIVRLVDLIGGKVCGIDVGRETWFKGCANAPQAVKLDTTEEGVALDLVGPAASQTVFRIADQARVRGALGQVWQPG